jgi:hypothetical protein
MAFSVCLLCSCGTLRQSQQAALARCSFRLPDLGTPTERNPMQPATVTKVCCVMIQVVVTGPAQAGVQTVAAGCILATQRHEGFLTQHITSSGAFGTAVPVNVPVLMYVYNLCSNL